VEKLLQREGKTAIKLDELAVQLGFKSADACSRWWARTSTRCATSKPCCAPPEPVAAEEDIQQLVRKPRGEGPRAACWWWASIR
jgi:GTP pyrophosphokinase